MTVDAIVLAGALNKQPLSTVSDELLEALIPVAGRPMIQWVLDALRESRSVGEIAVIGPSKELRSRICGQDLVFVDSCDTILNNVKRGLSRFQSPQKVLIVTADVPLLTGEAVDDFVSRCQDDSVQVYYSIVRREVVELAFEDISRTYVTIKDGRSPAAIWCDWTRKSLPRTAMGSIESSHSEKNHSSWGCSLVSGALSSTYSGSFRSLILSSVFTMCSA